jgi:hypothetical protein
MKKMRRMIPALCMLLVSAIMLSTASYAWFTMNEQVTATGMQVQAEATGSLVIGKAPLQDSDKKNTTVLFDTTQKNLTPLTWLEAGQNGENSLAGWYEANGSTVDPVIGSAGSPLLSAPMAEYAAAEVNPAYFEEVVYVGSAGEDIENQVITLNIGSLVHLSDDIAHKAYAAAIYVYEKQAGSYDANTYLTAWGAPTATETPNAIIHVADWDNLNTVTIAKEITKDANNNITAVEGFDIPSVVGLTKEENRVGVKIVIRVFVDGNLEHNTVTTDLYKDVYYQANSTETYDKAGTTTVASTYKNFNDAYDYYTREGDGTTSSPYVYTPISKTEYNAGDDMSAFFVKVSTFDDTVPQYCINSNKVPTDASSLEFTFRISDAPVKAEDATTIASAVDYKALTVTTASGS